MSSASDNLIVFFMLGWALLIVASFVKAVYSCIRKMCYGDEGRIADEDEDASAEIYRSMSSGRQEEIDNLRKLALLRYLSRFTLVSAYNEAVFSAARIFMLVCSAHSYSFTTYTYTSLHRH
jgi:hypothetical protein